MRKWERFDFMVDKKLYTSYREIKKGEHRTIYSARDEEQKYFGNREEILVRSCHYRTGDLRELLHHTCAPAAFHRLGKQKPYDKTKTERLTLKKVKPEEYPSETKQDHDNKTPS